MSAEPKLKIAIYLSSADAKELRLFAADRNITYSEVVRLALNHYYGAAKPDGKTPVRSS